MRQSRDIYPSAKNNLLEATDGAASRALLVVFGRKIPRTPFLCHSDVPRDRLPLFPGFSAEARETLHYRWPGTFRTEKTSSDPFTGMEPVITRWMR